MSDSAVLTPTRRRPDRAALVIAVALVGLAALIAWDASHLRVAGAYAKIGPATIPYAIAVVLFGLAIWTAAEAFRGDFPERETQELRPVLWIVGGLLAQMLLLPYAGFSIATGLLFGLTARGFGKRQLWFSIPLGIVLAALIWLLFARVLQLSLPAGPPERAMTGAISALMQSLGGGAPAP